MANTRIIDYGQVTSDSLKYTIDSTSLTIDTNLLEYTISNGNITTDLMYITIDDMGLSIDTNYENILFGANTIITAVIPKISVYIVQLQPTDVHIFILPKSNVITAPIYPNITINTKLLV